MSDALSAYLLGIVFGFGLVFFVYMIGTVIGHGMALFDAE